MRQPLQKIISALSLSIFIIGIVAIIASCKDKKAEGSEQATINVDSVAAAAKKQVMISELKKLHTKIISQDKNQIQSIFNFPLADSTTTFYADDPQFNEEKDKNNGLVTKEIFLKYFDKIAPVLQFEDMDALFTALNVDSLAVKDTLEKEIRNKNDICYHYYQIQVENDIVILLFGTNTNSDYKAPKNTDENDLGCAEWTQIWRFRFDGEKLQLVRQDIAG